MSQKIAIIGAGPAGEAAAKTARKLNKDAQIFLVEKEAPGGLCLNKGCIPSKTLLERVHWAARTGQPVDWPRLQKIKNEVVTGIRTQIASTLKREKIDLVKGMARFSSPSSFEIAANGVSSKIEFDKAILTAGTEIFFPPPLDQFKDRLLNSDTVLELTETPKSVLIVGGGAIGIEFACLLRAAGSKVIIIEMTDGLLPGEDSFVVSTLTKSLEARGIRIKTGTTIKNLKKTGSGWSSVLNNGETIEAEHILACVGRLPAPEALNVEKGGIKTDKKKIVLNDRLQTTNKNVYAAGDGTLTTRLAHAAAIQAQVAATNALGGNQTFDDSLVPRCLYSWPEVASVGKWKYQLEKADKPVKTSRAFYKGSARALAADETEGFVQIVFDPESKKLLGAQIIGLHATELIHIFSVALKAEMTTDQLGGVVFAHPTLAEMVKEACLK